MRAPKRRATLALAFLVGCAESARPPPAELDPADGISSPLPDSARLLEGDALHPSTYSPCGATAVGLEFQRPNLYFVIDASGSMLEGIDPGQAPESSSTRPIRNRYDALAESVQQVLERVGHRVRYGATLFPGSDTCDPGREVLELAEGDTVSYALTGTTGPTLITMMLRIRGRTPGGGTPIASTLRELLPRLSEEPGETFVFLLTDGGPNCAPDGGCGSDRCMPNLEGAVITDGRTGEAVACAAPVNCCSPRLAGSRSCLDDTGALDAVAALSEAGIVTFVIGIPGSEAYADLLDALAIAGGMPREGSPSYYRAADAAELSETVGALGQRVALACRIELASPPPDPNRVNVFFDGTLVESDPVDGWRWADEQTLQLVGSACELLETGQVLQADIVSGCPSVLR